MRDLPAVAQHGNARGNDIRNGAAAQASRCACSVCAHPTPSPAGPLMPLTPRQRPVRSSGGLPPLCRQGPARGAAFLPPMAGSALLTPRIARRQHGYPHPRRQQLEQERQQQQQQHHEQEGGYGQYAGYYDEYGQWHAQAYNPQQQSNGGGWDQVGGYGGYAGGVAPPKPPKPEPKVAKGKGFSMKMGDRAHVAQSFTLEQRQAREGKGVVGAAEAADEYGADILLGAGGMVRCFLDIAPFSSSMRPPCGSRQAASCSEGRRLAHCENVSREVRSGSHKRGGARRRTRRRTCARWRAPPRRSTARTSRRTSSSRHTRRRRRPRRRPPSSSASRCAAGGSCARVRL